MSGGPRAKTPESICRRVHKDVIAPPGELFSETNDNSVAILLTYGSARVSSWPATPRRGRKSTGERFVHEALNGYQSLKLKIS
jgi:hypothetical protein